MKSKILPAEAVQGDGMGMVSVNPYTQESMHTRFGTVAAAVKNVAQLNTLLARSSTTVEDIRPLTDAIGNLLPALRTVGMFDLFTPNEWIEANQQPGRVMAGLLYIERFPQEINKSTLQSLQKARKQNKSPLLHAKIDYLIKKIEGKAD